MRYPRSSYNDTLLVKYDSSNKELLRGGITSGRVFWLKSITVTNSHASNTDHIVIYDDATEDAEGASPGPATADRRLLICCGPQNTVSLDFAGPGIKFVDGMVAGALESPAAGIFSAYGITITGYEA